MKSEIINGVVEIINETQSESIEVLNEMLAEHNLPPLRESEIRDWGIIGGETNRQLQEWANDYASEIQTERCAEKDAWRYEH